MRKGKTLGYHSLTMYSRSVLLNRMREDLPFAVIRDSDGEVLARIANLLLAHELFRAIAAANPGDEILLKHGIRIIESSAAKRSGAT
jgi:hypothetical protein